jgi:hypothetical protein
MQPKPIARAEYDGLIFTIEAHCPEVGAYLYIFFPDGEIEDYLQNSVLICQKFALEEFELPLHCWQYTGWLYTDLSIQTAG